MYIKSPKGYNCLVSPDIFEPNTYRIFLKGTDIGTITILKYSYRTRTRYGANKSFRGVKKAFSYLLKNASA